MYKSVAPESKKNPRTKLIKGHTHGIPLPVGYQPPTIQQNWTERAAISPFQPILPAQVSSSQNLLEPPLIIGELLPESPPIIGPTGPPITNPSVLQSHSATSWIPHQFGPSACSIIEHWTDTQLIIWWQKSCKIHLCALIFANERSLKLWYFSLKYICEYHCLVFFWLKQLYLLYFN